ncbi:polysaccharide pyruvyl transferase family protein [Myxosarcina sp. GI1(2024)]
MLIEIHGAGFQNKGAELMLRTTVHELGQKLSQFSPAIDPTYGAYESRCELRLKQIFPVRGHVGTPSYSKHFRKQKQFSHPLARKIFTRLVGRPVSAYGCVNLSNIQALVDISGFAYTDQWGIKPTQDFAELTAYYKSQGKPIILLPQAFGPFNQVKTKSAFSQIVDNATLIFARDEESYLHAVQSSKNPQKVLKAPDITLFYLNTSPSLNFDSSAYVCIVPNARMLDQGKDSWGEKYETYLISAIKTALSLQIKVYIVVHDSSGEDLKIAQSLDKQFSKSDVVLMEEANPIKLKKFIADSLVVIGSRYHSLVAAFSKCVPAIAIGWAHKYEMLFKDFGFDRFLVAPDTSLQSFVDCVEILLDCSQNSFYRNQIHQKLQAMHSVNQDMWDKVTTVLSEQCSSS